MARKKKQKEIETTTIGYTGTIITSVRYGDKTIYKSKHKNEGTRKLFDFLARCACGLYAEADPLRPQFIGLFNAGNAGETIPSDFDPIAALTDENNVLYNAGVIYKETPIPAPVSGNTTGMNITLEFMIPFTQLDVNKDINLCALYPSAITADGSAIDEPVAYFIVRDSDHPESFGNLLPDNATSLTANKYNLFVQWVMTFDNN